MAGTVLLIIADLSWFFVVGDIWKTDVEDSKFWASMQTSYTLIMFVSVLSLIAKVTMKSFEGNFFSWGLLA